MLISKKVIGTVVSYASHAERCVKYNDVECIFDEMYEYNCHDAYGDYCRERHEYYEVYSDLKVKYLLKGEEIIVDFDRVILDKFIKENDKIMLRVGRFNKNKVWIDD